MREEFNKNEPQMTYGYVKIGQRVFYVYFPFGINCKCVIKRLIDFLFYITGIGIAIILTGVPVYFIFVYSGSRKPKFIQKFSGKTPRIVLFLTNHF